MDAINTFGHRQDSASGNLMYPNRQGNKLSGAKTRREVIEQMLAANSFLLSETETKKMYSMFNIKDPPKVCIRDPFKDTTEDGHARYVSGTEEPEIMTETFLREFNLSKFVVDNKSSFSRGDRSNEIENLNERNQFETRDVSLFNLQRSPFIRERSPLNSERNSLGGNGISDNRRDSTNMSWERTSFLNNRYKPGRFDHFEDPFKHTNYAISRIRKRKHYGREFPEVYGHTSWNYHEESTNTKARYEEEDLIGRYLFATRQPETMAGSFSRQESDMHSGGSPLGYDRASNSIGQMSSYEMNTFGGGKNQVHRETRGRSPFYSGRNDIHPENHRRSSAASERTSFERKIREGSSPTSERNRSSYEMFESPLIRERNSLDRNRSFDNLQDTRNMSRETRPPVDERIYFIPPRDNPYEPDRSDHYEDPFKHTDYAISRIRKRKHDDRGFPEVYGQTSWNYDEESTNKKARYEEDLNGRYLSATKQPDTMAGSFSIQESDMHNGESPLGYDRASNSYGQIPSYEMNTFEGEKNQVQRETRGRSSFDSGRNDIYPEAYRRSSSASERSSFGRKIRERTPPTSERNLSSYGMLESPLNHERNSLDRNRSFNNLQDIRNMSRERMTPVVDRIDFIPPRDNPYEPDRIDHFEDPFKHINYAISRIRKTKHDGREFPEVYGQTSWNYDKESTNKKEGYEEEDLNERYLSVTKQPEMIAGSFSRRESHMDSGESPLGYDRASNSYGQIPSYEMNTFEGEKNQVQREFRRSSFGSLKNDIYPETHRRSSFASERSSFGRTIRERSPPTSERNLSSYEMLESPLNRERNSLDRNRSSDNLQDMETGQILQIGDYGYIPADSKIKVVMWIPKGISSGSPMGIIKKLAEQNARRVTNHWRVLKAKHNPQKASRFLLQIIHSDVTALQKFDMKPILHKKNTNFVIQG
ncbi:unnamed protein product [Diabrotica balteata]|uniref:Uncharacterized protein n=1 Tax=Diabrotica balteata TaxID=107213 RepID=A0A9N9SRE2_DIABA|nr:unnamed protein product [Diabrotica balteata]